MVCVNCNNAIDNCFYCGNIKQDIQEDVFFTFTTTSGTFTQDLNKNFLKDKKPKTLEDLTKDFDDLYDKFLDLQSKMIRQNKQLDDNILGMIIVIVLVVIFFILFK